MAVATGLILHTPPVAPSPSALFDPAHTDNVPVIDVGAELTVSVTDALQPVVRR